jgi:ferredoxin
MAIRITEACVNCDLCAPECPTNAISMGEEVYVIDPKLCTECVGFSDDLKCNVVCPAECCVPDPEHVETEAVLFDRARAIFPHRPFYEDFPSHFLQ